MLNNKLLFFLCIALFSFMVSTFALASQKNGLASELDKCRNPPTPTPAPTPTDSPSPSPSASTTVSTEPSTTPTPQGVRLLRKRWIGLR